jgi:hypothetical protein
MTTGVAFGQTRAFMTSSSCAAQAAATPPGTVSIEADPGEVLSIYVWLQDADSLDSLNAYQLIFPCSASGGNSGSISYIDNNPGGGGGDTINIDKTNPDWIFINAAAAAALPSFFNETCPSIFGVIYNYLPAVPVAIGPGSAVPHPGQPNYVAQFSLQISADACGTFTLPFNIPPASPPLAAIFNTFGAAYGGPTGVTFDALEIIIGPANDACADAANAGNTQVVNVDFDTACASADGPQTCATGSDIWYTYTTPLACQGGLQVGTDNGDVAVYGPGASCGALGAGQCNPGPIAAGAGETYRIQVIGTDIQGRLDILCQGCEVNADCNDNNPCTTDSCSNQACTNTPNSLPCSDGNVCTLGDACSGGSCAPGPVNDCNDFNPCTADSCSPGAGGDGCVNDDVTGNPCGTNADCEGGTCQGGLCQCQAAANFNPPDSVRLDVRGCDNEGAAIGDSCSSEDSECGGPSPDGILQCSDNNGNPLDGGICVDQCCYHPGGNVVIDLELGPMQDGACGGQFFMNYDPDCLTFVSLVVDPDDELTFDFVVASQKNNATGDFDLTVSLPIGVPCNDANAKFLGGTVARFTFTASGECKCGGFNFRPHNPATKVSGPKGDIDLSELTGTDEIQIQGDPLITCPPDSTGHSDCGSVFRTVTYGPVTITDECEEITADITDLCEVEFRKACQGDLDCGRGPLCGPNTDCGPGSQCLVDPLVAGSGFVCDGVKCVGYCSIDTCTNYVCSIARDPQTIELDAFLDCSDGCELPPGEIRLVCSYTNGCGRTAECNSKHFNSGQNLMCVDLEMSPTMAPGNPNDPIVRCIELELAECDAAEFPVCHPPFGDGTQICSPLNMFACGGHPEACFPPAAGNFLHFSSEVIFGLPANLPGHGSVCVEVPPGNWTCLTATDPKHSLTSSCTVECNEDNVLHAEFKGSKDDSSTCHWLVQGNVNGDDNIDIVDYTITAGQYLTDYHSTETPCKDDEPIGNNFNADFTGDGLVTLADWTFVIFNFFNSSKDPCHLVCDGGGAAAVGPRPSKPRVSMTRAELERAGLGAYVAQADANGDGVVNLSDMRLLLETIQDDGTGGDVSVEDLREAARKIERSHRERELPTRNRRGK